MSHVTHMHTTTLHTGVHHLKGMTTNKWIQIIDESCHTYVTWTLSRHTYAYCNNTDKNASSHRYDYVKQVNVEHGRVMSHIATWNESNHIQMQTASTQSKLHHLTNSTISNRRMQTMDIGWLRIVGSLKLQVSFAKEPYKTDDIL